MKEARTLHIGKPAYLFDNGGRRRGFERRQFDYSYYFPERRVGLDRRTISERRNDSKLNS
jgi:hypothetical protein